MNTGFSIEQAELRTSIRRLLEDVAPSSVLRQLWDTETGRSPRVWKGLAEIGVPALLVPPEYGGLGADELDLFPVLEEAGRAALPDAVLESCMLAPLLLAGSADDDLKRRWLPALAAGEARATVAFGSLRAVPDAHLSDVVLAVEGEQAVAYERADVTARPVPSMDPSRRLSEVTVRAGSGRPVDDAPVALARAARLAGSAVLLGGAGARLVEFAVAYAKVREQFGRPIGSFQAIKHQLATAHSRNALARHAAVGAMYELAHRAASSYDTAVLAHLCALEAARESNRVSLQVHGGIGFTWEHDLQIWLNYGKSLELGYGTWRETAYAAGAPRSEGGTR
ncbi:acyl-CoA dehydrogenase family protein [Amycolatopsis pithecellobii]|uniref:Acyl-CoA dehydrogenase n=1 Tax=Amycolatopsis pithecellobii TaxID=664692 RepID=A0A6N7YRT4_9PSEU|nr:acyl-CoA dehydrogenase family protein [Amycolatopsis pithecellobii]MTD54672.1 acyl-CoA dehydrogenase [Amycolatopsis pithecellobii]